MEDIIVVGAGLGGLATGAIAAEAGQRVLVLDAHAGNGRAATTERDGFVFNGGPRALYRGGAAERALHSLGIHPTGGPPSAVGYGSMSGVVDVLPAGPSSILRTKLLGVAAKVQLAALMTRLSKVDATALANVTMDEWLADAKLKPEVEALVRMVLRVSTYCEQPDVLSADAGVMMMQSGLGLGVIYLDDGWKQLTDGLRSVIAHRGSTIRGHAPVRRVMSDATTASVELEDGTTLHASSVVLAVGGPVASARVLDNPPVSWSSVGPDATVACLELGLRAPTSKLIYFDLDEPLYYSVHCPPARLAPPGQAVAHAMRYLGADSPSPAEARSQLEAHAAAAGVASGDIVTSRYLHRMVASYAIPTAANGGLPGRPSVMIDESPRVFVAGDWVGPEGMLADAVFASASQAVRAAMKVPAAS
jgi:phytoene dehydrogenase-like protein